MAAIRYRGQILAVLKNKQLLEKRTCEKFQIDIKKTEGLVRVYTDRRTDVSLWVLQNTQKPNIKGDPFLSSYFFKEKNTENSNLMGNVYYHSKEHSLAFIF